MKRITFNPPFKVQWQTTWQLAWPVMLANLSLPLLGLADAAVLGHLESSVYLAGVTAGASLMAFIFWGFNFLSMGLSGFTSQALGASDERAIIQQLQRYSLVAAGLIVLVVLIHRPLISLGLRLLDLPDTVAVEARQYLQIRMLGVPAIVFNAMLIGFFIGLQNTRIGLYTLTITQLLNIGLNILLVFGLGYKTAGIAIGSVISEYLGLLLILWHLQRAMKPRWTQRLQRRALFSQLTAYKAIFQVSQHLFIRTFVLLSAFVWFTRMGAQFGEATLAANGLLLAFFTLISHFLDGGAAAAEAQTGRAVGQKNHHALKQTWVVSAMLNGALMLALTFFLGTASHTIIDLLSDQADVIALARAQQLSLILLPITGGLAFWLDGVFIGARRSKDMRNSVVFAMVLFLSTSLWFADSNTILWLTFNVFFASRSLYLAVMFYRHLWRKDPTNA